MKKDTSHVFTQPVSLTDAPDYRDVISHPMDLSLMRQKNENGEYLSFADLVIIRNSPGGKIKKKKKKKKLSKRDKPWKTEGGDLAASSPFLIIMKSSYIIIIIIIIICLLLD